MFRSTTICSISLRASTIACASPSRRSGGAPSAAQLAELWVDASPATRALFAGPAGNGSVRPATDARFTVVKRDTGGFSITYRVRDERGRDWSVKVGPEAQTEMVASRIVWGLGDHEVPSYFVERWTRRMDPRRGSNEGFEREPFITGVENGLAVFAFHGRRDVARIRQKITQGLEL